MKVHSPKFGLIQQHVPLSMHLLLFCLIYNFNQAVNAQFPGIEWQVSYGGTSYDYASHSATTADGGYIIACYSSSLISGNKTVTAYGNGDYWLIKVNAIGSIEWQKVYGGTNTDYPTCIEQTADGGYILGGFSNSVPGGNKTASNYGMEDCWVLKLNPYGDIEWQTAFGGAQTDYLYAIHQLENGHYLAGAHTSSGVSGNKTEASKGASDYWIVTIDSDGNKIQEKVIGGASNDVMHDLQLTTDGGYIVGGTSDSEVSGDKNESVIGDYDFWVVKVDSTGNIMWQNTIGGSLYDELAFCTETSDGGFLIGGASDSPASGDKSEPQFGGDADYSDFWIVKLKNNGDIFWENTIGGNKDDLAYSAIELADGTLVVGGYSTTNINGDKTEPRFGGAEIPDIWVVALNPSGSIIWQSVLGGTQYDRGNAFLFTPDGGCLITAQSSSGVSGNKTTFSFGYSDGWLIKLNGICIPTTETCNEIDDDCNGLIDDDINHTISISAAGDIDICPLESVVLLAEHTGINLQWRKNEVDIFGATSPEYTATATGDYTCISFSNCDSTTSTPIHIVKHKNPKAGISADGPTTFCAGGSVTLTEIPSAGCTYQWYKGASAIGGATLTTYVATTAGNYKCLVTKTATGCFKTSNVINVSVPCKEGLTASEAGEEVIASATDISVYPNPATDNIQVDFDFDFDGDVKILNQTGELMATYKASQFNTFDISNIPAGVYILLANDRNMNKIAYFVKQ